EGPLYALAVDDAHNYHALGAARSNPGRGWVVVRAPRLTASDIVAAMQAGEFYASSGVRLRDVRRDKDCYEIEIEPEQGVTYTTQFIGTREGFDRASKPILGKKGEPLPVTPSYSQQIGEVLSLSKGTNPSYKLKGDEIYVRARIVSSRPKVNPYAKGEFERAWTQPLIPNR